MINYIIKEVSMDVAFDALGDEICKMSRFDTNDLPKKCFGEPNSWYYK